MWCHIWINALILLSYLGGSECKKTSGVVTCHRNTNVLLYQIKTEEKPGWVYKNKTLRLWRRKHPQYITWTHFMKSCFIQQTHQAGLKDEAGRIIYIHWFLNFNKSHPVRLFYGSQSLSVALAPTENQWVSSVQQGVITGFIFLKDYLLVFLPVLDIGEGCRTLPLYMWRLLYPLSLWMLH